MRTAPKLRDERVVEHIDWLFAEHILVWRGTLGNQNRQSMLAAIERALGDDTINRVPALTSEGDVSDLLRCDQKVLEGPVLEWLRQTLRSEGFGGYPSYGQWISVLRNAVAQGRTPQLAPEGTYPVELLRLGWSYAQLCLFTNARLRRERRLGHETIWPRFQVSDALEVLSSDRDDLAQRFARWNASASAFLSSQGIALPATLPATVKRDVLTRTALGEHIESASAHVSLINHKYLEQPESRVSGREFPKIATEPVELQVAEFRARLFKVLDHVLMGQHYVISSHSTPKALLRPLTRAVPSRALSVFRKEFEADLAAHLNRVQAGTTLIVRSVKEQGPTPGAANAVIAQPPPKRLVEERRALTESQRKESGRARMRKVREHRRQAETEQQAEIEAKLQAIDGLSLQEVKEAVRLLKKSR